MRNYAIIALTGLSLAGCASHHSPGTGTVTGAAVGAGAGAVIGAAATGSAGGALAGAAIGGVSGAIIGSVADRPGYCYARDQFGRTVVVRCP